MNNKPCVLLSIKPRYCDLIASGKKTVEVRKTKPKIETPFKCYIYCTINGKSLWYYDKRFETQEKRNGKVIGEFVCDRVEKYSFMGISRNEARYKRPPDDQCPFVREIDHDTLCLTAQELEAYGSRRILYGWHISDLVIYDEPKELSEFIHPSNGCCNEGKCRGCKWLDCGNGYNIEDDCLADFDTDMYSPVKRPPQSWCYVDELKGADTK